jgi:hypothetical protein
MGPNPSWEACGGWSGQEILRVLWNPKAVYCIHKIRSLVPILSQMNIVHSPTTYDFKITWIIMIMTVITITVVISVVNNKLH